MSSVLRPPSAWERVAEVVLSAPASDVDFSGLNGEADFFYSLRCDILPNAALALYPGIRLNGVTFPAYSYQYLVVAGALASPGFVAGDTAIPFGSASTDRFLAEVLITAKSGAERLVDIRASSPLVFLSSVAGLWNEPVLGVNQVSVTDLNFNGFGAGSRFTLFRAAR